MKYKISEDVLSQMIFYNVLQCLRKHCVPEEYLDDCVVDISTFHEGAGALKSETGFAKACRHIAFSPFESDLSIERILILLETYDLILVFPSVSILTSFQALIT